jgi:hypothetical protein
MSFSTAIKPRGLSLDNTINVVFGLFATIIGIIAIIIAETRKHKSQNNYKLYPVFNVIVRRLILNSFPLRYRASVGVANPLN